MKHIANKMKRMPVAAAALLLALSGCVKSETGIDAPMPGAGKEMSFTLSVPGMRTPSTRTLDADQEKKIAELDVVIFSNTDNTLLEHHRIEGSDVTASGENLRFTIADIRNTDNITAAIITNASAEVARALDAAGGGSYVGAAKADFLLALQVASSAMWNTSGDDYWRIPMYGETVVTGNLYGGTVPTAQLTRMLAKVDVINEIAPSGTPANGDFQLLAVHVVNQNMRGVVAPKWNASTGALLTTAPTDANLPSGFTPATRTWTDGNEFTYTPDTGATGIENKIYLFESNALYDPAEDPAEPNAGVGGGLRLVFEGRYTSGGTTASYYYPVDFAYEQDGGETKYMPVLRNHRYVFTITEASGRGYSSLGEAVASYTVQSNLKTRIIYYDESVIRDMVFNGQYMLGVDNKAVTVTREAQDLEVAIFADNPAGWTASIVNPESSGWLRFAGGLTSVGGNPELSNFTLAIEAGSTSRTATIALTSGRLSMNLTVTQTTESGMSLRIIDANGNDVTALAFGYGAPIPSQRFYVVWTGTDNCTITNADGSTAFAYAGGSDRPLGTITGGAKSYDITAAAAQSDADYITDKASTLTFTITDSKNNTLARNLTLAQIGKGTQIAVPAYVGAFWRAAQRAERVISIPVADGSGGTWSVSVLDYGPDFNEGDILLAAGRGNNTGTDDPDISGYYVTDGSSRTAGNTMDDNNKIVFRIGLNTTWAATTAKPARYATIVIAYNNGTKFHKLYLRQGEGADYLMRTGDAGATRIDAKQFSPYNLTHPDLKSDPSGTFATVGDHPVIPSRSDMLTGYTAADYLTEYPSQAGAFFTWATDVYMTAVNSNDYTYYQRRAFHPSLSNSSTMTNWNSPTIDIFANTSYDYWDELAADNETCPPGYRRPSDGSTTGEGSMTVAGSEMRQSLWLNPQAGNNTSNTDNSVWGYYADGFFDRRTLGTQTGYAASGANAAVNTNKATVAYAGNLCFNPFTNASLFFPGVGLRSYANGFLNHPGSLAVYWTSSAARQASVNNLSNVAGSAAYFNPAEGLSPNISQAAYMYNIYRNHGAPVRCVVDPDYTP